MVLHKAQPMQQHLAGGDSKMCGSVGAAVVSNTSHSEAAICALLASAEYAHRCLQT
jgi:hypothetical protein